MKVFLSSILREYIQDYDPKKGHEIKAWQGMTVSDLCSAISIPLEIVAIIMVDGRMQDSDYVLNGTERVYLFPAIGGG